VLRKYLLALLLLIVPFQCCEAFDEAGHFYTAYALAETMRPGEAQKEQLLVAFCAQLPDLAEDLDAVRVYWKVIKSSPLAWATWAKNEDTGSDDVRKMVTVQQLLHALTGGSAEAVRGVADANLKKLRSAINGLKGQPRAAALCAFGLGLHFYGDSYAHQHMDDIDKTAAGRRMYPTGRGHAVHLHYPDYVLCSRLSGGLSLLKHCDYIDFDDTKKDPQRGNRTAAWIQLWEHAPDIYDPDAYSDADRAKRLSILSTIDALGKLGTDRNDWSEGQMRIALGDERAAGFNQFFKDQTDIGPRPCQAVLRDAIAKLDALKSYANLACSDVWQQYRASIAPIFEQASKDAREDLHRPYQQIYVDDPLAQQ
jgi:hypothetical protein